MSTEEIDRMVYEKTTAMGGIPAPLNYQGFPKSVCTSINEEVCHGIPSEDIILKDDNTKLYIPIRAIAKYLNYNDFRGDYKIKSEDSTKCYVKNENEIAMFTKDSDTLVKTRGDSDYEYVKLEEKVLEKDGELYTTPSGIEKAFNILFEYNANKKNINI